VAFAVEDFRDLLQLLRDHPEWKAELRRELLGEELLQLPELVRQNTAAIAGLRDSVGELRASVDELRAAQLATEARLAEFIEATNRRFERLEAEVTGLREDMTLVKSDVAVLKEDMTLVKSDVAVLKEDMAVVKSDAAVLKEDVGTLKEDSESLKATTARLESGQVELRRDVDDVKATTVRLESGQVELRRDVDDVKATTARLESGVNELRRDVDVLKVDVGDLKGTSLEAWWQAHPHLLVRGLRRPAVVPFAELDDLIAERKLPPAEEDSLRRLYLVVRGRVPGDGSAERYFAVEVSAVVDTYDVERASERAAILRKLGLDARALVAGNTILPEAEAEARDRDVGVALRER
jgi:predicted nuclease with TOPRIM domain